ncbi:hypothetical protein [Marivirga lumbricoides]
MRAFSWLLSIRLLLPRVPEAFRIPPSGFSEGSGRMSYLLNGVNKD